MDAVRNDPQSAGAVPEDARNVIEMLNHRHSDTTDRRNRRRAPFVTSAAIELTSEPIPACRRIYVRDLNYRGVGFVTPDPLPVGKDAILHITPGDEMLDLRCSILRCREVIPGWYEGAVLLYTQEPRLANPVSP